jgi:type IV secretory pathway TrbD component
MTDDKPKARINRVYKSLHKPLTYLGVERNLFFLVCVVAVSLFTLFNSLLAAVIFWAGGFMFGQWATEKDPAWLKIIGKNYNTRYDAAKQQVPNVEIR